MADMAAIDAAADADAAIDVLPSGFLDEHRMSIDDTSKYLKDKSLWLHLSDDPNRVSMAEGNVTVVPYHNGIAFEGFPVPTWSVDTAIQFSMRIERIICITNEHWRLFCCGKYVSETTGSAPRVNSRVYLIPNIPEELERYLRSYTQFGKPIPWRRFVPPDPPESTEETSLAMAIRFYGLSTADCFDEKVQEDDSSEWKVYMKARQSLDRDMAVLQRDTVFEDDDALVRTVRNCTESVLRDSTLDEKKRSALADTVYLREHVMTFGHNLEPSTVTARSTLFSHLPSCAGVDVHFHYVRSSSNRISARVDLGFWDHTVRSDLLGPTNLNITNVASKVSYTATAGMFEVGCMDQNDHGASSSLPRRRRWLFKSNNLDKLRNTLVGGMDRSVFSDETLMGLVLASVGALEDQRDFPIDFGTGDWLGKNMRILCGSMRGDSDSDNDSDSETLTTMLASYRNDLRGRGVRNALLEDKENLATELFSLYKPADWHESLVQFEYGYDGITEGPSQSQLCALKKLSRFLKQERQEDLRSTKNATSKVAMPIRQRRWCKVPKEMEIIVVISVTLGIFSYIIHYLFVYSTL